VRYFQSIQYSHIVLPFITRAHLRGICGKANIGCSSIIVKKKPEYETLGLIVYTATSRQGAKALFRAYKLQQQIRVFRTSTGRSNYSPLQRHHVTFRYDGLFKIINVAVWSPSQPKKDDIQELPANISDCSFDFVLSKNIVQSHSSQSQASTINQLLHLTSDQTDIISSLNHHIEALNTYIQQHPSNELQNPNLPQPSGSVPCPPLPVPLLITSPVPTSRSRQSRWNKRIEQLKIYRMQQGNLDISVKSNEFRDLGNFVKHVRYQYKLFHMGKQNSLSATQIAELDALQFCWEPSRFKSSLWSQRMQQLRQYKAEHGVSTYNTSSSILSISLPNHTFRIVSFLGVIMTNLFMAG